MEITSATTAALHSRHLEALFNSHRFPCHLLPPQLSRQKTPRVSSSGKSPDPYKDQIQQLKLHIRELKLDLKQITTNMPNIRSQYYETAAFMPRGLLRWSKKAFEDFQLLGPQQQKQHLQEQIVQLERELLSLQQAQAQWKAQQ
jgi:hypothetical protein